MSTVLHHPETNELEITSVMQALSDPHRLQIVRELADAGEPRRCGSFGADLGLAKSTLTHHFRILREAGIVEQRRDGTAKLTSLRRDDLDARFPGLLDAVLASSPVVAT